MQNKKLFLIFFLGLSLLHSSFRDQKFSLKKALTDSYKFVPSGNVVMDGDTISVQAFYIYEKEVTNQDYREFLMDLKNKGDSEKLKIAQIDSASWNSLHGGENNAYVKYYHVHPAYNAYPVVNVSFEAAQLYCKWLGEKYDEKYGVKGKFLFRLMEKAEYIRACRGDSDATYAWGTHSLNNSKGKAMCNFTRLSGEHIHRNAEKNTYEIKILNTLSESVSGVDILAQSKSYWPNEFKVYNLNGNAAEMIAVKGTAMGGSWKDTGYDVRIESERSYSGPNPMTGFRVVITSVDN